MNGYQPLRSGVPRNEKGSADGVATLDANGQLTQLPNYARFLAGKWAMPLVRRRGTEPTLAIPDGRVAPIPLVVDRDLSIDRVAVQVTAAVAATAIHLGLYASAANGLPGALIQDFGTVDASTTGVKEITISPARALTGGVLYHLATLAVGGGPTCNAAHPLYPLYGLDNASDALLGRTAGLTVSGNTSLPATMGALTATLSAVPLIAFRVAA